MSEKLMKKIRKEVYGDNAFRKDREYIQRKDTGVIYRKSIDDKVYRKTKQALRGGAA